MSPEFLSLKFPAEIPLKFPATAQGATPTKKFSFCKVSPCHIPDKTKPIQHINRKIAGLHSVTCVTLASTSSLTVKFGNKTCSQAQNKSCGKGADLGLRGQAAC